MRFSTLMRRRVQRTVWEEIGPESELYWSTQYITTTGYSDLTPLFKLPQRVPGCG
ncbi:hypothetical protein STEG23_019703, partial [Scotinomys teguina]